MKTEAPITIHLKNYQAPAWLVDAVDLRFNILEAHTEVFARLTVRRNPARTDKAPLMLDGEDMKLKQLVVDGRVMAAGAFTLNDCQLIVPGLPDSAVVETRVVIDPAANTQLSGLYRSKDGLFTQCEAEGFRRITFYPDRPDVMARFSVSLEADRERYPLLLSNGNPVASEDLGNGRHRVRWEDPFPKPAYLFALVAAKLDVLEDHYLTRSGRRVRCAVYVEPGKLDQCAHAMRALKLSMKWDEDVFGLEMDLDHYMIVAVGDFNMGAMENKGLNIFNTKYVLARPDTATDTDFQNIDRVVAHEYFHNWTGNRVTCRDWFQLSLKEGLTVFRDQQFGMDVHSAAVTRIQEVRTLRGAQFPEDSGPMAHPIRPASYAEINNFYTATVYEKGAEVIRMVHTLLGPEKFRAGMDLYFQRHDGQAVTCDDFVAAMADASGVDLTQFRRWYGRAGTPTISAAGHYDAANQRYTLTLTQSCPVTAYEGRLATAGLDDELARHAGPLHIPVRLGLVMPDGNDASLRLTGEAAAGGTTRVFSLTTEETTFVFEDIEACPVPSLLRGFSAPVHLEFDCPDADLAHRMAHDGDPVNRWEAGQTLAMRVLLAGVGKTGTDWIPLVFVEAMRGLISDRVTDPALIAEALALPSELVIGEAVSGVMDPEAIHLTRQSLRQHLARTLSAHFLAAHEYARSQLDCAIKTDGGYQPNATQSGWRALANACLGWLAETGAAADWQRAVDQFDAADNMTDRFAALSVLANVAAPMRETALAAFYDRWQNEALVIDKWLQVQATSRLPGTVGRVRDLMAHPAFSLANPNKVYALIRSFVGGNPRHFHAVDGTGYRLAADVIIALQAKNPQVASRIARGFDRWTRVDADRQRMARAELERIAAVSGLSPDVAEVVGNALGV